MLFTKPKKAIGIDIGTHSVKAVQMGRSRGRLVIEESGFALVDRNQVSADPVSAHAAAVRQAIDHMAVGQSLIVGALRGQTAVIRYPRLPDMPRNQIPGAIEAEASQNIPYDLSEVFLDHTVLDTVTEGETKEKMLKVMLVAAKKTVVESRVQIADAAEFQYGVLSVDSLALADAAESCGFLEEEKLPDGQEVDDLDPVGRSVALVNIGLTSTSIHFTKNGISNFIREVSWGASDFVHAIEKARRCPYEQAEADLQSIEQEGGGAPPPGEAAPQDTVREPDPGDTFDSFDSLETPSLNEDGSDTVKDVEVEEWEMGGAADGGGMQLEEQGGFNAFGGGGGGNYMSQEKSVLDILAQPLSRLVSEIRRSLEFYDHHLYESAVRRLILSGGVAHLAIIRESLIEELGELGVERVEVADPTDSALLMGSSSSIEGFYQHPAQFMIAVGLAARGMADL